MFIKLSLTAIIAIIVVWIGNLFYHTMIVGQYYINAGLHSTLFVILSVIIFVIVAIFSLNVIWRTKLEA